MPPKSFTDWSLGGQIVCAVGGVQPIADEESAFDPEAVREMEEAATRIEEAYLALARALFAAEGRLAFPDDPLITPLVNQVAREYWQPAAVEPTREERAEPVPAPAIVYGLAERRGEESPRAAGLEYLEVREAPPTDARAVVVIGGSEADFRQFGMLAEALREPVPLYVISSAVGRAPDVRRREPHPERFPFPGWEWLDLDGQLRDSLEDHIRKFRTQSRDEPGRIEPELPEFRFALYPAVMARIIESLRSGQAPGGKAFPRF